MKQPTHNELVQALRAAGTAHHDYETHLLQGMRDEQWPGWYAAYVLGRLGDFTTPTTLAIWLSDAPGSEDWAESTATYVAQQLL